MGVLNLLHSPQKRGDDRSKSLRNLETKSEEESEDLSVHDSDLESLMNRPIQSNLGDNDSREAFSGSSCSGSSTSSDCCSGSVSEEEEDGCLDNREDVADALTADNNQNNSATNAPAKSETRVESAGVDQQLKNQGMNQSNSESRQTVCSSHMNCRAWRPDDAFRPQSLPSLTKQDNNTLNSDWHNDRGAITWHIEVLCRTLLHALSAMKTWISQTLVFSLVHVDFGFAFSVTKGFLMRMGDVLDVGNVMIPLMGINVSVDELQFN